MQPFIGLDPAGPLFETGAKQVKLNEKDALFVEVIHTNGFPLLTLGSYEPMGKFIVPKNSIKAFFFRFSMYIVLLFITIQVGSLLSK